MSWIKRNLFFVIGAVIAVGLLVAAGLYGYKNWQHNKAALNALNETYATFRRLNAENPSPGNDQINNIQTAREQERELRAWIRKTGQYFQPIPPVPDSTNGVITDARFASARDHTLSQLHAEAANASVTLPPHYGFSFEAERALVRFAPGSLGPLAQQLGDVKAISGILFAAKVNSLDNIRRVRVSTDDANGPQSDYLNTTAVTNSLAVLMPFEVTFRGFSQDLAHVLTSLASSPHGFIVTGINVQAASAATAPTTTPGFGSQIPGLNARPPQRNPGKIPPGLQGLLGAGRFGQPSPNPSAPQSAHAQPSVVTTMGGLPVVLNEQLLSITLDIDIVKLLPKR